MKNIVIILITLLTFSTDVLSQSLIPFRKCGKNIDWNDGYVLTNCSYKTYSFNKKVNIKKCDTTKYIYKGKTKKNFRYFVDVKLKEIVVLSNCNKTYVDKYYIKKYKVSTKPNHITGGYYLKLYIVCKSENKIMKIIRNTSKKDKDTIITIYDKKTKNTTVKVVKWIVTAAKGDYYE
tara:strand:+ start:171 stop:701 length:531 start_codon:yes stop_codon:yes gene_type:complete